MNMPDPATAAMQAGAPLPFNPLRERLTDITGDQHPIEDWVATYLPPAESMAAYVHRAVHESGAWDNPTVRALVCEDGMMEGHTVHTVNSRAWDLKEIYAAAETALGERMMSHDLDVAPVIGYAFHAQTRTVDFAALTSEEAEIVLSEGVGSVPQARDAFLVVAADCAGRVWWAERDIETGDMRSGDPVTPNPMWKGYAITMRFLAEGVAPSYYALVGHYFKALYGGEGD